MKPVICLYCGTQMIAHDNGQGRYWYYCQKCAAYSPFGFSAHEAFEHAQRRYEPPVKPLTWEDLSHQADNVVYLEDMDKPEVIAAFVDNVTPIYANFKGAQDMFCAAKEDMSIRWRAWPCKPSMEVRTMVEWSSESRDGVLIEQHGPDVTAYIGTADPKVLFLAIEAIQVAIHSLGLTDEYAHWLSKVYRHPEFEVTDFSKYLQPTGIEPGTTVRLLDFNEQGLTQMPREGDEHEF